LAVNGLGGYYVRAVIHCLDSVQRAGVWQAQGAASSKIGTTGIEAASRYDTISRYLLARGNSVARISTNDLVRLSAERTWCGRWAISLGGRANSVWRGRGESIASGTAA
jgi:hypothetical protein